VERELTPLTASECAYCGGPIPARKRRDARYCSTAHRVLGNRRARREAAVYGALAAMQGSEFTDEVSLAELYDKSTPTDFASPAAYIADDDEPGDDAEVNAADEHDAGVRRFLGQADASHHRMLWKYWNSAGRRTCVQPAEQVAERVERRRASQQSNVERLERAENQVEQRHVPASRGVVARSGRASRELNAHYRRAQDTPPPDMQGPVFDVRMMPQVISRGDRGSRAAAWQMDDGFRFCPAGPR